MSILLRALIIEDSEDDTLFVLRTLRKGGYDPIYERVETAEEMDAALRKHEWDVVLADYSLPHFNAPRALEQLKNTSQDLPFIVISGTVGEDIAVEVMKAGAHDFFIKGNLTRLVSAIEREIREAAIRQERKRKDDELKQIEWLLTRKPELDRTQEYDHNQFFGDLAELNTCRVILDSVGEQMLNDIVSDYLSLLDTSAAVYEKNGDYALRMVSSDWCRFMNQASRKLCGTEDTREAQDCGKWLCHESCWTQASKVSIETGTPVNIECNGGINIYAVPILAGDEIVGSINFGYGDPPCDKKELQKLAEKYEVNLEALNTHSAAYESRPPYIIELAKYRLRALGRLIGEIVARKQAMDREQHLSAVLRAVRNVNQLITKEDDKDRLINSACSTLIETLGYSHAWIALIDSSGAATALAQSSANAEATAEISTVLGHGELPHCARRAIISGVAIAYDPVSDCKSCTLKEAYAGCGGLATRLEYNDTTYGVIVISLPVEHLRDEEEQALFLELASDLGFALWKIEMTDRRRELERRNAQYARIVANTQDAMALVDRNYVFQEVNSSYAKLHDMTVEDLKGCSIKEVMGEEFFRNTAKPRFDRCLAGEEVKIETTVETPGTGVRFVSALYSPCHEPDGTTGAAAVCVHDITDLYQAQREIEQLARFTFENPNPVLRISVDGNILYANNPAAAALEIMGLGAEGKIDNKWQFQIRAAMETGQPRQEEIAIGDAVFEATFAPILELGYVNIYMSDISERKRMEEALRDSEVLIRAVMDNLPVGVAVNLIDPSVEFIYMNDNFIRFYRTTREALTTEDAFWESVFEDPEFREQIKKQVLDNYASGNTERMHWEDIPITRRGEEMTFISARITPVPNKQLVISTVWDTTARKKAEGALQASLRDKNQLIRELFHRTKNNMQVIMSMLLWQADYSDKKIDRSLLQEIVNRIQTMALVQEKLYQSQNLSSINLDEYIRDLVNSLEKIYDVTPNKVTFVLELDPIPVLFDIAVPCGLILNELISNSFKHAFPNKQSGEIKVELYRSSDKKSIELTVSDNGIGLPLNFDFKQSKTFGLSSIVAIVEHQLQGKIVFEGENGFTCRIQFNENLYEKRV